LTSFPSLTGEISTMFEKRKIPRTGCLLTDIDSRNKNITVVSIENISPEGCLLNFKGELCSGDKIDLEFWLPDNPRKIEACGIISYVIRNCFKGINSAGVLFADISEINQKKYIILLSIPPQVLHLRTCRKQFQKKTSRKTIKLLHQIK
jgi:hypothetical protein